MIAKTEKEIEILREGGRRLARHLSRLTAVVRPGMTTREMEDMAFQMVEDDGDEMAFKNYKYAREKNPMPSGLNVSINDAIVHTPAGTSGDIIQEGDVVTVDFGIKHGGFLYRLLAHRDCGQAPLTRRRTARTCRLRGPRCGHCTSSNR